MTHMILEDKIVNILEDIDVSVCSHFSVPEYCTVVLKIVVRDEVDDFKKSIEMVYNLMCSDSRSLLNPHNKDKL